MITKDFKQMIIMKKQILAISLSLLTLGLILITSAMASAQAANEFTVPLSDPAKRGKLKAHLNYGSITVKGTARKDVLVKYRPKKTKKRLRMMTRNRHMT